MAVCDAVCVLPAPAKPINPILRNALVTSASLKSMVVFLCSRDYWFGAELSHGAAYRVQRVLKLCLGEAQGVLCSGLEWWPAAQNSHSAGNRDCVDHGVSGVALNAFKVAALGKVAGHGCAHLSKSLKAFCGVLPVLHAISKYG